jgi:fatty-acyl-CoA synthase
VLMERFAPRGLLDTLRTERADVLTSVPTVLTATLRAVAPGEQLPVLDAVLTGAAPVRTELIRDVERAFATTVFNLYGQTEMAPVVSLTRPDDPPEIKATTVGRPMPHLECRVVDPATGDVRACGEEGELMVRGYQKMLRYEGDPAATAAAMDADGWLHTGDLMTMDGTGALRVVGRLKDLIIRGGENIAPAGIEAVLAGVDGIRDVAVVGVPDELWGEVVGAVVVPDSDSPADVAAWTKQCRTELAGRAVPQVWFVVDALPTTASGKIAKGQLRDDIARGALVATGSPVYGAGCASPADGDEELR